MGLSVQLPGGKWICDYDRFFYLKPERVFLSGRTYFLKFLSQHGLDKLMDETKIKKKKNLLSSFSQLSLDKLMDET